MNEESGKTYSKYRDWITESTDLEVYSNFDNPEDYDELLSELNLDESDDECESDDLKALIDNPWNKSFDILQKQMTKVDDFMYKSIIKVGDDELFPQKARVAITYHGFWEREQLPFDSTNLIGKPMVFVTGNNEILVGLERAVKTMTKGEESQFLISWEYLYGVLGCPPRIKPEANGLFIITLLDYNELSDNLEVKDEVEENSFDILIKTIEKIYTNGNYNFQRQNYQAAAKSFKKAIKLLENYNLKDECEQNVQQEKLIKLYTNLSVCYNHLCLPLKTFCVCNELSRLSGYNYNTNCKAIFQEGKAYLMIHDYKRAKMQFKLAIKLEPKNEEIIIAVEECNKLYNKSLNEEGELKRKARNIIQIASVLDKKEQENKVDKNFQKQFEMFLKNFIKNSEKKSLELPEGFNIDEINWIRETVKDMNIKLENSNPSEGNIYTLIKML